jgi:hypothetical protein
MMISSFPDHLLDFDARSHVCGVIVHDDGSAFVRIGLCPGCGIRLNKPDCPRHLILRSTGTPTRPALERPAQMKSAERPRAISYVRACEDHAATARFLRHPDFVSCSLQAGS